MDYIEKLKEKAKQLIDSFAVSVESSTPEPADAERKIQHVSQVVGNLTSQFESDMRKLMSQYDDLQREYHQYRSETEQKLAEMRNKIAEQTHHIKSTEAEKISKKEELSRYFAAIAVETMNANREKPRRVRAEVRETLEGMISRISLDVNDKLRDTIENYDADVAPTHIENNYYAPYTHNEFKEGSNPTLYQS